MTRGEMPGPVAGIPDSCFLRQACNSVPERMFPRELLIARRQAIRELPDEKCLNFLRHDPLPKITSLPEMSDPRENAMFWVMRKKLGHMFGSRLPFAHILKFVRQIANNNNIKLCRMIARKKDVAIEWLCQHIDIVEPHLVDYDSSQLQLQLQLKSQSSSASTSKEDRIDRNSSNIVEIEQLLTSYFGHKPTMKELVEVGRRWGNLLHIKLDRAAKRNKLTFECWISEHLDAIKNLIARPHQSQILQPPSVGYSPVSIISCLPDDWDVDPNEESWSTDESMFNLYGFDFK
jgi:hypothetical protein